MNKKVFYFFSIIILIVFLLLFFFGSNIFENEITLKTELTISQINKFESDIKNGVEIDLNDYLVKEKNYDNIITKTNKKISNMISGGFKKLFKYLLKNINF